MEGRRDNACGDSFLVHKVDVGKMSFLRVELENTSDDYIPPLIIHISVIVCCMI